MRPCVYMLSALLLAGSAHAESDPASERQAAVQKIVDEINESYIDPHKVEDVGSTLQRMDLSTPMSDEVFAKRVTAILAGLTSDPHLKLMYSTEPAERRAAAPTPADIARRDTALRAQNYGIERVERLPGNIGYLKTRFFAPATASAHAIGAAMTLLANSDALIIDLRENDGGASDAVPLLASYLFDERTHLADIYTRKSNITEQQWTSPAVPGLRFGGKKDVYVLTSSSTFSAAEGLAFALQNRKRIILVGEATRGGAHPSRIKPISAHLALMVPTSMARDPVTLQDWEGVGVKPDVAVPATEALTQAQILILDKLRSRQQDADVHADIKSHLELLVFERGRAEIVNAMRRTRVFQSLKVLADAKHSLRQR